MLAALGWNRWRTAGALFALAMLVAVAVLVFSESDSPSQQNQAETGPKSGIELLEFEAPASKPVERAAVLRDDMAKAEMLLPEEVIDNRSCRMTAGRGAASELALAVIPGNDSARFSIVNGEGTVFSGALPFRPFQFQIGRRQDGTIVAGLGGIHLNPFHSALPAGGLPLRVLIGNEAYVDKDNVWLFGVADDGSSYFYIEALGNDYSSRLVVSNWKQGTEHHFDLGKMFSTPQGLVPYLASYTPSNEEIYLRPVPEFFSEGVGSHYFFSANGDGQPRRLRVPDSSRNEHAHFVSSTEAYFLYSGVEGAASFQVVKTRFDWTTGEIIPIWQREGPASLRPTSVDTSPDGAWLLFGTGSSASDSRPARESDSMLYVLDAISGQTNFSFPKSSTEAQLSQLASVLPPEATAQDAGEFRSASFVGKDQLAIHRQIMKDGVFDRTAAVYDVFDLTDIGLHGQPEFRVSINLHATNSCASRNFPRSLQERGGKLVFARRTAVGLNY